MSGGSSDALGRKGDVEIAVIVEPSEGAHDGAANGEKIGRVAWVNCRLGRVPCPQFKGKEKGRRGLFGGSKGSSTFQKKTVSG